MGSQIAPKPSLFDRLSNWLQRSRRKNALQRPFRRIYKGEVPLLQDQDADSGSFKRSQKAHGLTDQGSVERRIPSQNGDSEGLRPRPSVTKRRSIPKDSIRRGSSLKKSSNAFSPPQKFPNNKITSARYSLWNFLPKNLFEQLRRIANFYFVVIAVVQLSIDTPVHPITAIWPLSFVLLVTAIKQGYEDWLRHKADKQVNDRIVHVVKDGMLEEVMSKNVQVGDVIKLESNDAVPCDLLLLGSSDDFLRCQINTANLDGETNLKLRYCPSGLPNMKDAENFQNLHCIIECEHPSDDLYTFNGSILIPVQKLRDMPFASTASSPGPYGEGSRASEVLSEDMLKGVVRQGSDDFLSIPLSMENMLLRGTRLKNTDFVYGLVIYTGRDTRLAKNSEATRTKFSTIDKAVNYFLALFLFLLVLIIAFGSVMNYIYAGDINSLWYMEDESTSSNKFRSAGHVFNTVASFAILFNYIIPISLYVSIELQKFLGSFWFVIDDEMTDEEGTRAICNTSDINEELGLIQYLFSDKTGTLTQNIMKFRCCSIDKVKYEVKLEDQTLLQIGSEGTKEVDVFSKPEVFTFFETLALCHSVQVVPPKRKESAEESSKKSLGELTFLKKLKERNKGKADKVDKRVVTPEPISVSELNLSTTAADLSEERLEYQASSPDEKALLEVCDILGVTYLGEKEDWMSLNMNGNVERYKRLMTLEFDADRKCMSVIVVNGAQEIWLLTKGAESSVIPKCDSGPKQETLKHVMDYARMGLRTLAVARRKLTQEEYDDFNRDLSAARRLLKNRQEEVRRVYMSIENHMTLIGATGVEDQLQEHVPETLQSFAAAGIRVWMLTGDKLETAVNVAVSCGLVTTSTRKFIMSQTSDKGEIKKTLLDIRKEIDEDDNTCFVIDGETLGHALRDELDLLREVSMAAYRVVCCRMAPLQKAQVVNLVKSSKGKPTTCAVGDGANDCAMILAADVGIGIMGKEGRQAARCADFALAKFGYLRKALLVHGHWYYVRLANMNNYFFYKNIVFILPQLFFSFNSKFTTQTMFNGLFLTCFNLFFASVPIMIYGITEQPYPAEVLLKEPDLYKKNANNSLLKWRCCLPWFVFAVWHAIVCFYLPYFVWDKFDRMDDVQTFGTVVFSGIMLLANTKIVLETNYVTWLCVIAQMFSYLSYFFITAILSEVPIPLLGAEDYRHVFFTMLSSPAFWLLMMLVGLIGLLPDVFFKMFRKTSSKMLRLGKAFRLKSFVKLKGNQMSRYQTNLLNAKRTGSMAFPTSTLASDS